MPLLAFSAQLALAECDKSIPIELDRSEKRVMNVRATCVSMHFVTSGHTNIPERKVGDFYQEYAANVDQSSVIAVEKLLFQNILKYPGPSASRYLS